MDVEKLLSELEFKAVRSSGPGGQHVNKTSSKITVQFHIDSSQGLSDSEKSLLKEKLSNRISSEGYISLSSSDSRSQHRNKTTAISRLIALLKENLKKPKKRKKSKPSKQAIEKRLKSKRERAIKKARRKPPGID